MDKKIILTYNFHTIYQIYLQHFFHAGFLSSFIEHLKRISQKIPMDRQYRTNEKGGVGDTDKTIDIR